MNFDFSVYFNQDYDWHMEKPHFHNGFEILLSLSEGGNFFVEKRLYPLHHGTLLLLDDAVLHHSTTDKVSYQRYVLHFSRATLAEIATPKSDLLHIFDNVNHCFDLDPESLMEIQGLFDRCLNTSVTEFGGALARDIAFLELFLAICRKLNTQQPTISANTMDFVRIAPIIDYIQNHLSESITLDELSEQFFFSKYYLCRIFKSATGFRINEYINYCRVLKSCTLLRKGCSVQEAGEKSGFTNNANFIRVFGRMVGKPPGKYARDYRFI